MDDDSNYGVFFADADSLIITDVNQYACIQTGYDRTELVGTTPFHLCPELDRSLLVGRLAAMAGSGIGPLRFATRLRRRDGSELAIQVDVNLPPATGGQPAQLVAVARGISERPHQPTEGDDTGSTSRSSPPARR